VSLEPKIRLFAIDVDCVRSVRREAPRLVGSRDDALAIAPAGCGVLAFDLAAQNDSSAPECSQPGAPAR